MHRTAISALLIAFGLPMVGLADDKASDMDEHQPRIPFTQYVLDNGLTLVVHQDTKAPIVAVNVWYHVGSKNEPPGRSGFAHLFEHLMFNGSEHFDDDYFQVLERVGATDLNGTTNEDRTNYFQNVPKTALDVALWMESDRMGHLLGAISQDKLDEQRGVVQNEKRQGENQPYGLVYEKITEATWPKGHPYDHTVIGSMEDLDAATLEDVREWFRTHYGPNNAVVVIAGDIEPEEARQQVEKYFGDIPPGPPTARFERWIAKRSGEQRQVMQDRVPQARIYKVWNVPEWGAEDADYLDLASDLLALGKSSRLYKRLVYEDQIATDVSAYIDAREIASQFTIVATARPGVDLAEVEKALDEELARFLSEDPPAEELERIKTQYVARFVRGIERIGGFGGKSDILARGAVFKGDPGFYQTSLQRVEAATPADIRAAAVKWLSDGVYVLEVHPFPELQAREDGADRSQVPTAAAPPAARFPDIQRATLSNGMKVVLAERHAVPLVEFALLVDAGYSADHGATLGRASLAMGMLDEGTESRSSLEIADQLDRLGATLSAGSNLDTSVVSLSALKQHLEASLELFADVILHPSFPQHELDRLKQEQLAKIQREKVTPMSMGLRVLPKFLYGEDHAYSVPFTGSGTEESVQSLTRDDLIDFHRTWFKPNNSTLVVVGDITMAELTPILERLFKEWERGDVPDKNVATVSERPPSVVYLMDRPGSQQSIILAGQLGPPKDNPDEIAIETMITILGGSFTSRLNMNLREEKHWSYGARTILLAARGQRPLIAYAPVQTDKTSESMVEVLKEFQAIREGKPVSDVELDRAQRNQTLTLAGQWETSSAVASSIAEIVNFGLPDDFYETYAERVRALETANVQKAANDVLQPDRLVWVIVGDRAKIEASIRALDFGPIQMLDADGNPIGSAEAAGQ